MLCSATAMAVFLFAGRNYQRPHGRRFDGAMLPFFMPKLTGYNMPKTYRQPREPAPSAINEKTGADFNRVVEQTSILKPDPEIRQSKARRQFDPRSAHQRPGALTLRSSAH
jgi:hypothetical protein